MTLTNTFTSTDLQYLINTVYSPKVEREWQANLLAADFFTDLSGLVAGGGNAISIADVFTNQFTASSKTNSTQVTLVSPAQAQLSLSINTWKEISYIIEDKEIEQVIKASDYLDAYASQARYIIAKALDTSLMGLYSGLSVSVNDTATDVTDSVVRQAIESVVDGDVPFNEMAFFFHPTVIWHDLMGIAKYTNVYQAGSQNGYNGPVITGAFGGGTRGKALRGVLYGVPVYETTNVQADGASSAFYNLLATPKAFMFGVQTPGGKRVRSQAHYWAESLGTLWTTDIIYGVAELRDDCAVAIKSRQSGIVS